MKEKRKYMGRLIPTSLVAIFLISMIIRTPYFFNRIIMLPFLICSLTEILKNIFLIIDKPKIARILNKIYQITFLIYWFGFLGYWCYLSSLDKKYSLLILSVPFWLAGIYIIYKSFFKKKDSLEKEVQRNRKRESKVNFKVIISSFLIGICLLSGIAMLFFGIRDTYQLNKTVREYSTTNGYFSDYAIYHSDKDGTTYRLFYTYEVEGMKYTAKTDYGTNYIPDKNSIREVKYNPKNPEEAILVGSNSKSFLILMGLFFTLGSFTFILIAFSVLGYFDHLKVDIIGAYVGFVILIIGSGIILFQNGETGSLSKTIQSLGFWILIPILFITAGIYLIIKKLFLEKTKQEKI